MSFKAYRDAHLSDIARRYADPFFDRQAVEEVEVERPPKLKIKAHGDSTEGCVEAHGDENLRTAWGRYAIG